jgi:hypothetical protein
MADGRAESVSQAMVHDRPRQDPVLVPGLLITYLELDVGGPPSYTSFDFGAMSRK